MTHDRAKQLPADFPLVQASTRFRHITKDTVTNVRRPTYDPERVKSEFWAWVSFFQDNGLTTRPLLASRDEVDENFVVRVRDLTDLGFRFLATGHQSWLGAIARRPPERRTAFIERESQAYLARQLKKLLANEAEGSGTR